MMFYQNRFSQTSTSMDTFGEVPTADPELSYVIGFIISNCVIKKFEKYKNRF